ncbi:MAG TPA: PEP/pyruvate-binding domain-containing protein [Myxococcota bacterium]|nr:PEP/pyruvate-binding domain-containing protein [Myxococcota bacterium]HOC98669.1 PEP/pyruvate-binding domain-containing protein [Myxococcota bacterium]HOH77994.1 PEP/pyruvate-binding domain-containing protein [Myxococcota bacterium]
MRLLNPSALLVSVMLAAAALAGCGGGPVASDVPGDVGQTGDDHTVPSFASLADFLAYAGEATPAQVKFVIRDFQGPAVVHFEEPGFYAMHDEWSWFSLLNGIEIPGYDFAPINGMSFPTVGAIFDWARGRSPLPLDLVFVAEGTRLYSPKFYDRAFNRTSSQGTLAPRFFGCGSVLYFPPDDRRPIPVETWGFELEYGDVPTETDVERFFESIGEALPEGVAGEIIWIVRSETQKKVAQTIDAGGGPLAGRWATWDMLQVPGESQTYNPGISAGFVKIFEPGEVPLVDAARTVAVLREIPDDLPPVAAIVTNVPQTPLSHIGILAKARGTPNLYVAGIADDPRFVTWASYKRPIIVKATADGHEFREMSNAEWSQYMSLQAPRQADIQPVDVSGFPDTFDPGAATPTEMEGLIPMIGGKTAGFIMLNSIGELDKPDAPIGITVRGYREFIDTLDPPLDQILAHSAMTDSRVVLAVTEGPNAYLAANGGSDAAQKWLDAFRTAYLGTVIGRAVEAGGIRQMVMTAPMDAGFVARITSALEERFNFLDDAQGLRFRSSSSAEDVEGFNGAGLYESHTGYLHPELQSPKKRDKTVEAALRRVWASYWLNNAFQERALAGIDHLAANMGVLVHPVFDDDREAANGVLTLELVRRAGGDVVTLTANMQDGALSVTNPPPDSNALPEVDVVTRTGADDPVISRVRASTEVAPGTLLLSDTELTSLLDSFVKMASDWLDLRNKDLLSARKRSTLTVDAEIKRMSPGWPSLKDGTVNPARLVLKQARTVERPVLAGDAIRKLPVPDDLLSYAILARQRTCQCTAFRVDVFEFTTDPAHPWPFDYSKTPFVSHAALRFTTTIPDFDFNPGDLRMLTHLHATFTFDDDRQWRMTVTPIDTQAAGFASLELDQAGEWTMTGGGGQSADGADLACTATTILTSPLAFLDSLM